MGSSAEDNQRGVESMREATTRPRSRGNYWEITYKKQLPAFQSWSLTKATDLATETGKTQVEVTAEKGTRAVNLSNKRFETCDFNHFTLDDSSFSDCTFFDCRFVKGDFGNVKFSRCRFEACHFLNVRFWQCQFLACTFSKISASAEHLHFLESSISAAAFVDALVTNLDALPEGADKHYQEYRLMSAKAKIARGIFVSVRDEPELDQLFDADRCFEIALQRKQIEDAYWTTNGQQLVKRSLLYRYTVWPFRVAALGIIRTAGFFTDWGRSPIKSLWFLFAAIVVFSAVYRLAFEQDLGAAAMRALDCTFVFGYTRYVVGAQPGVIDCVMFLNAFAGFCRYALLIPALSKRLFR
jgi:Pentapeptide repeats (9 copies)